MLAAVLALISAGTSFADDCPVPDKKNIKKTDPVPLCLVAQKIKKALDDYNSDPANDQKQLPKLSKAEFDFKTVRSTSGGLKFSILVFNAGATRQVDSTDEVTFSYEVPAPAVRNFTRGNEHDFSGELIKTIQSAAEQLKSTQSVGAAQFKAVTINLAYGVKWDFTAGATVPIQLVTIGGSFNRNKTSTQSVKLTFGK